MSNESLPPPTVIARPLPPPRLDRKGKRDRTPLPHPPPDYAHRLEEQPKTGARMYGAIATSDEDEKRISSYLQLSDTAKEFGLLRERGFDPEQSVREMDRIRNVERPIADVKSISKRLEEQTKMYRLMIAGADEMGDSEWRAMSGAMMLEIAQRGTGSARLQAIEAIDRKRYEEKFGTRAAVQKTLEECQDKLKKLDEAEVWAAEHGVAGAGRDARTLTSVDGTGRDTELPPA